MSAAIKRELPEPDSIFKKGTQNHTLYSALQQRSYLNHEFLGMHIMRYANIIMDVRKALKPYGLGIQTTKVGNTSTYQYKLVSE